MVTRIGTTLYRIATGKVMPDYNALGEDEKKEVLARVAAVALGAIGFSLLAGLIYMKFIWIAVLLTGVTFVVNTDPNYNASLSEQTIINLFQRGRATLGI